MFIFSFIFDKVHCFFFQVIVFETVSEFVIQIARSIPRSVTVVVQFRYGQLFVLHVVLKSIVKLGASDAFAAMLDRDVEVSYIKNMVIHSGGECTIVLSFFAYPIQGMFMLFCGRIRDHLDGEILCFKEIHFYGSS